MNPSEVAGWLVIFDRRAAALTLEERLQTQVVQTTQGRTVMVIRA